ncbi:DMT family transporter [Desulfogranum mediterraneum]|uniref:DMT family transporter n=1 Tax=Desulfogranum mediterraneum TaxID=160661 RepID=UPI000413BE47|nr:DMT family transporter [Desulfogranum mediterraneum]
MHAIKPYCAGIIVVFIWAGWITISRYAVHTTLLPSDITLLRYCTALVGITPLLLKHRWKAFKLHQYLVVGLGVGFPYTMFSFYGLQEIKAAQAGVVVNGMLPVMGAVVAWSLFQQRLSLVRWGAVALIFVANITMAGSHLFAREHLTGILLLLGAALVYTMHMTGIRKWGFRWQDALVAVAVVNVLLFVPIWLILPSALTQAPLVDIVSQALYQGIIVNIIALMCVAYSIRHLGTVTVSLFMAFVPVITALFAWIFLGEALVSREIIGIIGCSLGLMLYACDRTPTSFAGKQR